MSGYGFHWSRCPGGEGGNFLLIGGILVAAEVVLNAIWWLIGITAACAAVSFAAVLLLTRWTARREAAFGAALAARHERPTLTATVIPQVTQPERPAIPQVVNFNFYGTGDMAARVIRQQLPGTAGGATERNE